MEKYQNNWLNFAMKEASQRNIPLRQAMTCDEVKNKWKKMKDDQPPPKTKGSNKKFVLRGSGKLPAKLIKKMVETSGKSSGWEIGSGFENDKNLSDSTNQVYHNPTTGVTVHYIRGTADLPDVLTDAKLAVGVKDKRFKKARRVQKQVDKKYGTEKLFIIGSSLGGAIAEDLGKKYGTEKGVTIITIGKPVTPLQLIKGEKLKDNQHDIRTTTDPISFLKPLQQHKNDIILKGPGVHHPIDSHIGDKVLDHPEIRDKLVGHARKLPVRDLRQLIIAVRKNRDKKGKMEGGKIIITGLKKKELQSLLENILKRQEAVGGEIWLQTIELIRNFLKTHGHEV